MTYSRLLAVDPSLTCSGWALFCLSKPNLQAVGKIKSLPAAQPLATRLRDLQRKISEVYKQLNLNQHDVLVCEAQTTMRDPRAAIKVEQVRGIFEGVARARSVMVPGRINPRSVHFEVLGLKGKQLARQTIKSMAGSLVGILYGEQLAKLGFVASQERLGQEQDIVDAILIGHLGQAWIDSAFQAGIDLESFFEHGKLASKRRAQREMLREIV